MLCAASCSTAGAPSATGPVPVAITTEIYPVKDLVFDRTQFLPPSIRRVPSEPNATAPRTATEGGSPGAFIQLADLVTNLKEATDPTYWGRNGAEIDAEDSGFLAVKASPVMQQQVATVLADMRRFAANKQ